VRNTCYTALGAHDLKQKQVALDSEADEIEDTSPLLPVSLCKKATVEAVREAIAALPVAFREVVVLRELEGLSYKEISEFSPPARDFADQGFRLIGGRLDYINGREVAALVYQRRLHIINLFIWSLESGLNTAAESFAQNGYNVLHWERDGFAFWAVSDVSAGDLTAFADLAMTQT
jgi:hypothetical protein